MHAASFKLAIAFAKSKLTHDIEGHIVTPVVDRNRLAVELGDFLDK